MNENNEKFEKEKKRLQMLVKSDEMKQELETQLAGLGEESDSKQLKAHECKVKIQELKTRLVHFQKHSRELQVLTEKHEHIKKAREGNIHSSYCTLLVYYRAAHLNLLSSINFSNSTLAPKLNIVSNKCLQISSS